MLRVYSTACEPVLDLVAPTEAMLPVIDSDAANLNLPHAHVTHMPIVNAEMMVCVSRNDKT